jgi:GT2 family glycosyltransferase
LPEVLVTVVIPTLAADSRLLECLSSLDLQRFRGFEVIVVDNSGNAAARALGVRAKIVEEARNVGFGAAVNHAFARSSAPYLATLNDDATAHPGWLEALVLAAGEHPEAGMFASQVRLHGGQRLDSAGMRIGGDGSSKQRGHLEPAGNYLAPGEALFPSGSAALYRGAMLEHVGLFDESYFLYCEDVDLGLRGLWGGWRCRYVPDAVVEHRYSHSAGPASRLKAYYVERNRLSTIIKNFPVRMLLAAPFVSVARYWWHLWSLASGRGKAAEFRARGDSGWRLGFYVLRAHLAVLAHLPRLWRERRRIRRYARVSTAGFCASLRAHWISARQVAEL